jgi:hypothetical protein
MGEPEERRDWFELDLRQANIRAFVSDHTTETIRSVTDYARSYIDRNPPPGMTVELAAGLVGIYEAALEELSASQIKNLLFMFAAVFMCTALAYRSLAAGVLVLVPLLFGNVIMFAVMAVAGVGLFIYTLPVSALGIGVGIDYSLYMLARLRQEAGRQDLLPAYRATFTSAGRAVFFTALTVTAGVVTLWISEMRFQAILGVMLGVIMMANMVSSLLVLPSLLSLFKPRFLFHHD